jgi:hypothetical protein
LLDECEHLFVITKTMPRLRLESKEERMRARTPGVRTSPYSELAPMSLSVKSRPELEFWANSSSPLKWTEIPSQSYARRLSLWACGLNPRRVIATGARSQQLFLD